MGMGRTCGGVEEARPPTWGSRKAVAGGCHRGHGGSRFPQVACPPAGAAGATHVRDDSWRVPGQDANAGGVSARLGDHSPTLKDGVFGIEELSGYPDAPQEGYMSLVRYPRSHLPSARRKWESSSTSCPRS